ncbi:MAG: hypothetical protein ACN4G0_18900 [Polyangiales bacterium]
MSNISPPIDTSPSAQRELEALDLHMMTRDEIVAVYRQLAAPTFEEMHGEFAARLLDQGDARGYLLSAFAVNAKGRWLCKAFEPSGPAHGHGYNSFMTPSGVKRSARMRTRLAPSKLPGDPGDAFHLEYADFNSLRTGGPGGALLHTMFDEVRKIRTGLYLGIGRTGFTEKARSALHPFTLEGPVSRFVKRV